MALLLGLGLGLELGLVLRLYNHLIIYPNPNHIPTMTSIFIICSYMGGRPKITTFCTDDNLFIIQNSLHLEFTIVYKLLSVYGM